MQIERHECPDLAPVNGKRTQPMRGFDEVHTDIVEYIVRCTHKIRDERDTIQRLVSFPERRGMATQVIWKGNVDEGFYTSHLVTGTGRYTQNGHLGALTGRTFSPRTVADRMIFENKIYREWTVADTTAILQQLGLDVQAYAERIAKTSF